LNTGGFGRLFLLQGVLNMNFISNIWKHPQTSVAGLLIAVVTLSGVLSQNGITLGTAGRGTVVTLLSALATAILGLLARDPAGESAISGTSTKLGAWALITLLLNVSFLCGCSGVGVAQDIVNWTPALQSAVATVDSTAALLEPADAPIFAAATVGFDAASNVLVAQARAYLANPSADILAQLQGAVVTLQQQVNASLLQAAKISNPNSQQHALNVIDAVGTAVNAMLALVQSISSKAALTRMAAQSPVKLASVLPLIDAKLAAQTVAAHYGESAEWARVQVEQVEKAQVQAGF
jgi:hypothetical protein